MDFSLFAIPAKAGIHPPTTVIPAQAGIQSYHPLAARPSRRHSRAGGNPPTNHRHSRAGGNPATRCNCLDPRIRGDDENLLGIGVKTDHFRLPGREVVIPAQAGIHHQPPSFPRRRESRFLLRQLRQRTFVICFDCFGFAQGTAFRTYSASTRTGCFRLRSGHGLPSWIPACAGMTNDSAAQPPSRRVDSRLRGNDENLLRIGVKIDRFRLPGRALLLPGKPLPCLPYPFYQSSIECIVSSHFVSISHLACAAVAQQL